jgi:hypothetical protein
VIVSWYEEGMVEEFDDPQGERGFLSCFQELEVWEMWQVILVYLHQCFQKPGGELERLSVASFLLHPN